MNTRVYQKSFAGGEIAPSMFGRVDDVKYQNGAAKMRNMVALPQGAATKRAGLEFRASTKRDENDSRTTKSRLFPFVFATDEAVVLEFRAWDGVNQTGRFGTIRIHQDSGIAAYPATTTYIPTFQVTFSNASGFTRIGKSPAWSGTPPDTPPFAEGARITFTSTGTLPTGIAAGTVYYVRYGATPGTGFFVSTTPTGSNVAWTSAGTGTHSLHTVYDVGDAVVHSGLTYVAQRDILTAVGANSIVSVASNAGWFQQFTSFLELRHLYTEQELFELTYTQSFDVLTLAHPNHPVRELRRYASNRWMLADSGFNEVPAVQGLSGTATFGQAFRFDWIFQHAPEGMASNVAFAIKGRGQHKFSRGDLVFCHSPGAGDFHQKFFVVDSTSIGSWAIVNPQTVIASGRTCSGGYAETGVVLGRLETEVPPWVRLRIQWITTGDTYPWQVQADADASQFWDPDPYFAENRPIHLRKQVRLAGSPGTIYNQPGEVYYVERHPSWPSIRRIRLKRQDGTTPVPGANSGLREEDEAANVFYVAVSPGSTAMNYPDWSAQPNRYPDCGVLQLCTSTQDAIATYKVCALVGPVKGPASSAATVYNNLLAIGSKNTLTWSAVEGAQAYNVYKEVSGLFGYIGQTNTTTFVDDNITPDFSDTPPYVEPVFHEAGLYPGAVAYFDQRKCFAGALDEPNKLYMSKPFTETEFTYSLPSNDSDRIEIEIAAREANRVRHIVPLGELLLLTNASEWRVSPINSEAITPSTISVRPQSYIGANSVQPVIVNNSALFCAARGGHVREMGFNFQAQGFITGDLSLRAPHLFDDYTITDMAYQKSPVPIVWAVSTSGKLLGLTFVPEEQVGGWHQHDTDGVFESVCVVPGPGEDRVWVVTAKTTTVNNVTTTTRWVQRMGSQRLTTLASAIHVDGAKVYSGTAVSTMSGLEHLEGQLVSIFANGRALRRFRVTGGTVPLIDAKTGASVSATTVVAGTAVQSELQTTPVAMQIDGFAQGRVKAINKAWLKIDKSVALKAGPSGELAVPAYPYDATGALRTEEIDVTLMPSWQKTGQVTIVNDEPVPLTVLGMTYEVAVGG